MKPALVILAAGASSRLGEPKVLADIGGRSVLARLLEAGAGLDGAPPLVVTGADHDAIAAAAPDGVELERNPDWAAGRTGGVLRAAARRPGRDLLLAPADVPLVRRAVLDALADAWARAGAPARGWLAPRCAGRHGHPIVVGRALLAARGPADAGRPLRELRALADPLLDVPVDDPAVLDDLDTPADLAALRDRASS